MMTTMLFRLLSIAAPTAALPALLAGFLAATAGISLIASAAWIIASAALAPPLSALALAITCVRACGIGRAVFRYLERLLSHRLAFGCYETLQQATYRRSAAVIPMREGNVREGEFLHDLLTGCETLRDFYLRAVPPPLIALALVLLACAALLPLSIPAATAVFLLFLLHLALPLLLRETELRAQSADYRSSLLDQIDGRTELRAAGSTQHAQAVLDEAAATFQRERTARGRKREQLFTLLDVILPIPCVTEEMLTGIQYAVWVLALEAVLAELRPIPPAVLGAQESARAARHILPSDGEHTQPASIAPPSEKSANAPLIEAKHLVFGYHTGIPIVQNLSLTIRRGEHTAIIGESGAGKTTLASLLLRLWEPDAGTISYDGVPHTKLPLEASRAYFGAALQGSWLFSASIRDNFLRLRGDIHETAIWHALETAQLADVVRALPAGLDEPLGMNASRLSGGQRSRLLTALALAGDAPILLLDEPTAGLDAACGTRLITSVLADADARGATLIVITHDLPLLNQMKQVIKL